MSIDKVKTFWKTVVREREDFWSSLFKKYEDNDNSANLDSYLDNSSSRLSHLLSLSSNENNDEENHEQKAINSPSGIYIYYEEQPKPSDASDTDDESCSNIEPDNDVHFTKAEPEFVSEILAEENNPNELNCSKITAKKLVLVDSPSKKQMNLSTQTHESDTLDSSLESQSSNAHIKLTDPGSPNLVRHICRPTKQTPARKRFKLA